MTVYTWQVGLSISETASLLRIVHTPVSRVYKLVQPDRKVTTEITMRYNSAMQKSISDRTAHLLEDSRRPQWVSLQSAIVQETRVGTGSPKLDRRRRKNIPLSEEYWFLRPHADGWVWIWDKHESMDPPALYQRFIWWRNGVENIFFQIRPFNWAPFKCRRLCEYCCWPCASLYGHSLPIFLWVLPAG